MNPSQTTRCQPGYSFSLLNYGILLFYHSVKGGRNRKKDIDGGIFCGDIYRVTTVFSSALCL
jgi:hypothetical protein